MLRYVMVPAIKLLKYMDDKKLRIVGIGEIILDEYSKLKEFAGGVPANYIRHVVRFGLEGLLISRIGMDSTGAKLLQMLQKQGVKCTYIQQDKIQPTARVKIEIDDDGQPIYKNGMRIAAYDFLCANPQFNQLSQSVDAIIFTALGQRHIQARQTIQEFIQKSKNAFVLFDCNLRHIFNDSHEMLESSLHLADALKLNLNEINLLQNEFGFSRQEEFIAFLLNKYKLVFILLTLGEQGAIYFDSTKKIQVPMVPTRVVDLTGCGDAFGAAALISYLQGNPPEEILSAGLKLAAKIAQDFGAIPEGF